MRMLLVLAVLVVGCGGSDKLFKGDAVVAELRSGQPFCSQGETGPTMLQRTAVTEGPTKTTTDHPAPYTSQIIECDWTCGNIGAEREAFVSVIFYTLRDGTWVRDAHADPGRASCPTD